jgi:hypothetical protein
MGVGDVLRGSCLCGGVRYEITGGISGIRNCHCSICRKAHGAAFRTRAAVKRENFRFVAGEELLTFYSSSPGVHRGFCRVCGSPILSRLDRTPDSYGVPLGALDDDPGAKPEMHIFTGSKAPWFDITDDLPQYERFPEPVQ